MYDCFTRTENLGDLVEGVFRAQAYLDVFEQTRHWAELPACARHLVALVGEERRNRPPNLTGGSSKEYSHFSIPYSSITRL